MEPINDNTDDDLRVHNVWYADKVPNFITVSHLANALKKYVIDSTKKGEVKYSKPRKILSYPHIAMSKSGNTQRVWVTFDPDSTDGQFALFMCRQLVINENTKIYFNHFKNKRRDEDDSDE